jgi:hypothetical protein
MRVDVRDLERKKIGRIEIDPAQRPARARIEDGDRDIFLEWEAATDDAGRLRSCIVCGGRDLYRVRIFPQLTWFVVVLAFAGAAVGVLARSFAQDPWVLAALAVVLVLDIASLIFSGYRLVCYRCGSSYSKLEIARQHQGWNRAVAERHSIQQRQEQGPGGSAPPASGFRRSAAARGA